MPIINNNNLKTTEHGFLLPRSLARRSKQGMSKTLQGSSTLEFAFCNGDKYDLNLLLQVYGHANQPSDGRAQHLGTVFESATAEQGMA